MSKKVSKEGEKLSAKQAAVKIIDCMDDTMNSPEFLRNEIDAVRSALNVQLESSNRNTAEIATVKQEMLDLMAHKRMCGGIVGRDNEAYDQMLENEVKPLKEIVKDLSEQVEQQGKLIDKLLSLVEKQNKQIERIAKKADSTEDDLKILQTLVTSSLFKRGPSTPSTSPLFNSGPVMSSGRNGKSSLFSALKEEYSKE